MSEDLEEVRRETADCLNCSLGETRTNLVFGDGNPSAEVVFVGEAPGFYEDKQGLPFVGAAGKLLTELLASIGFKRSDVYIANVLKCRPPDNRDPLPAEIAACRPILLRQLVAINPKVIVTLGAFATRTVLNRNVSISRVHGQTFKMDDFIVFPIYHPAAALYARATRELLYEDFRKLKDYLEAGAAQSQPHREEATQLDLF